ncbi:hypothetical protein D7X33_27950 [Butyricicoccus sp. 1XD8-22]|nr:hypothetical protein D7X33_27950 [Butyricicoccus sp. 1XD8-22]
MNNQDRLKEIKKRDIEILEGTRLKKDWEWLIEQAEKLEKIEEAWLNGSGEDIDIELQEAFE